MKQQHLDWVLKLFHNDLNRGRNDIDVFEYPVLDESLSDENTDIIIWYHINKNDYSIATSRQTIYKP